MKSMMVENIVSQLPTKDSSKYIIQISVQDFVPFHFAVVFTVIVLSPWHGSYVLGSQLPL